MKLLRAQAHFGILSGQEIRFEDGMNVLYLPNEGGKSTLCNLIRVMLYGLNSKRDSKNQLSDKTKYRPVDGSPMSGLLELEWKGRRIVISRQTGRGTAPMQEFSAYYADTGEPCQELTAKDCGYTLTGVTEEGFVSSALLDGQEQALSAKELGDRMLALSTAGDGAMMYSNAVGQLDRWKNRLRGVGNRGQYAQVEAEISQTEHAILRLDELSEEIKGYQAQIPAAEQAIEQAEAEYQKATEEFTLLFVAKREAAEREERAARENLNKLRSKLPDAALLTEVVRAKESYEQALEAHRQATSELYDVTQNFQRWKDDIDRAEDDYSRSQNRSDIRIRGWSMILAVLCGVLAVISLLGLLPFGAVNAYMPYFFSVLAVILLIVTFMGSTKTLDTPPMDFDEERMRLERRRQSAQAREPQTAEQLELTRQRFWEKMKQFAPDLQLQDEQHAIDYINSVLAQKDDYFAHQREHEELTENYLSILDQTGPQGEARMRMNEKRDAADRARQAENQLQQSIAMARGKSEEIGTRADLCTRLDRLKEEQENILWQLDAIRLAKDSLIQANAELTGRVSPLINQLAQQYMQTLTANRYTAMQLYTNLEATCRRENSAVEMDRLRLSAGTRDQLYLALRLAVCKVLLDDADTGESMPIVLDDPFVNYDDERAACGMQLLREIARERQVILMTCRRP